MTTEATSPGADPGRDAGTGDTAAGATPHADAVARIGLLAFGGMTLQSAHSVLWRGLPLWHTETVLVTFAATAAGLALLAGAAVAVRPERWHPWIAAAVGVSVAAQVYVGASFSTLPPTDSSLFSSEAAHLVLAGENPYTWDVSAAYTDYRASDYYLTPTLDGSVVSVVSYPALHFLALVPFELLGWDDNRSLYVLAHVLLLALLYRRSPAALRGLVLLPIVAQGEYLYLAMGGVSDGVWALLLAGMVVAWRRPVWRALAYGTACAFKQTPWLLAPFLLARLLLDHEDADTVTPVRRAARFAGLSAATFLAFNGPFLLLDPLAWWNGVWAPAQGALVPLGTGLSALTLFGAWERPKAFFTLASLVVLAALAVAYVVRFGRLRHALWLFPAVVLWFSYRSLQSYYIYWLPVLLMVVVESVRGGRPTVGAEASAGNDSFGAPRVPLVLVAAAALVVLVALGVGYAPASVPMHVELAQAYLHGDSFRLAEIELTVENRTPRPLRPRFGVQAAGWQPLPWRTERGPDPLPPGRSGRYRILSDVPYRWLSLADGGQVVVTDASGDSRLRATLPIPADPSLGSLGSLSNTRYWQPGPGRPPLGWRLENFGASPAHVERSLAPGGEPAVEIGFRSTAGEPAWELVRLSQAIPFPTGTLRLRVAPETPLPRGPDDMTRAYGLEVHDGARRLWILFGPGEAGSGDLGPDFHYELVPTPPGVWSTRVVDLAATYARRGWKRPALRPAVEGETHLLARFVDLGPLIAARRELQSRYVAGRFGPIEEDRGPDPVARAVRERVETADEYYAALAAIARSRGDEARAREYERRARDLGGPDRR